MFASVCQNLKASIGLISSAEQKDLVCNYLRNKSFADNVWIGIKKIGNSFKSIEAASLEFKSWSSGHPIIQTGSDCVEMNLNLEGKWLDAKYGKKNAVLCEKNQQWSNSKIENILQELRENYTDKITLMQTEISKLKQNSDTQKNEIANLKQNSVPIGFIYVQLSGQKDPQSLWPNTKWNNISPNYSAGGYRL